MASREQSVRVTGRCSAHPGSLAIAACDGCGRRMCLACTVPVRGGTVGNECLARVLGPDAPEGPAAARRAPGDVPFFVGGAAFLGAVAASIGPWTNSLTSSHVRGIFGSWEVSPVSWALASSTAAALGFLGWMLVWLRPTLRGVAALVMLGLVGGAAATGAVLFIAAPPFATHPFLGPWLMILAGSVAALGCWVSAVRTSTAHGTSRPPG